jgi:hypothetical protein
LCAAALLLGCPASTDSAGDQGDTLICSTDIRPGIDIEVRDSRTGAPAACGATAEIREDDYVEALDAASRCVGMPDTTALFGAWERAGTYKVTVHKAGYLEWAKDDVMVVAGKCHVETVTLQANLEPAP